MTEKTNTKETTPKIDTVVVEVSGKKIQVPTDAEMRKQGMDSLSARIRHLSGLGLPTGEIRKIVIRANGEHPLYQHVRNVLNTPVGKKGA